MACRDECCGDKIPPRCSSEPAEVMDESRGESQGINRESYQWRGYQWQGYPLRGRLVNEAGTVEEAGGCISGGESRLSWWRWRFRAAPPWWHPWPRCPLCLRRPLRPPRARIGGPHSLPLPVSAAADVAVRAAVVKAAGDVVEESTSDASEEPAPAISEAELLKRKAKKTELRRKRLVRKRKLRKKGKWPPSKMAKLKNV